MADIQKNDWHKNTEFNRYIGCSLSDLKIHIENKFTDGMTWANYGKTGWHIDHIIPLSSASNELELQSLCHYSNLSPLWSSDNLKKSNKLLIDMSEVQLNKYEILPNENINLINQRIDTTIFARKCTVKRIDVTTEQLFFETNHFSGYQPSKYCYGLFFNNELVSAMSFSKPRFDKKYDWEIIRYATNTSTRVIGGASKLFCEFIKEVGPENIITYSDLRFGSGDVYNKLGMQQLESTKSNYWYVKDHEVLSRYMCMKHKLKGILPIYLDKLTEKENMYINGYKKYKDLGNAKFVWTNK